MQSKGDAAQPVIVSRRCLGLVRAIRDHGNGVI